MCNRFLSQLQEMQIQMRMSYYKVKYQQCVEAEVQNDLFCKYNPAAVPHKIGMLMLVPQMD
jgi:hypothetical protein